MYMIQTKMGFFFLILTIVAYLAKGSLKSNVEQDIERTALTQQKVQQRYSSDIYNLQYSYSRQLQEEKSKKQDESAEAPSSEVEDDESGDEDVEKYDGNKHCKSNPKELDEVQLAASLDASILSVTWAGKNNQYILLVTKSNDEVPKLYWSNNSGKSFKERTQDLIESAKKLKKGKEIVPGVLHVFVHPQNPDKLLLHGEGKFYWQSTNGGKKFTAYPSPGGSDGLLHIVKDHPEDGDFMLARVKDITCLYVETSQCKQDLYYTTDFGKKWNSMLERSNGQIRGFVDFDWGYHIDGEVNPGTLPKHSVVATVYFGDNPRKGGYTGWDQDMHFVRSDDFFKTNDVLVFCGSQFETNAGRVYLARPTSCPVTLSGEREDPFRMNNGRGVKLSVSVDDGDTFEEMCLPSSHVSHRFALLPTHDDTGVFVLSDTESGKNSFGHTEMVTYAYVEGLDKRVFMKSLENVYGNEFETDFTRVKGMPGVYIANKITGTGMYEKYVHTEISYNGGVKWEHIKAPSKFNFEVCNACANHKDDCYLHLHGPSQTLSLWTERPSLRTYEEAPGLIIGVGHVAPKKYGLSTSVNKQCTWVSRDGGRNWVDVASDAMAFDVGDYGGAIVMARHSSDRQTQRVLVSQDGGQCWDSIPLSNSILVDDIRVESAASRKFIVHGYMCDRDPFGLCNTFLSDFYESGNSTEGMVYLIDLDKQNLSKCNENDYEDFVLKDGHGSPMCTLGMKRPFKRRKPGAKCLARKGMPDAAPPTPCTCDKSLDFSCDFGFVQGSSSGKSCELDTSFKGASSCRLFDPDLKPSNPEKAYESSETGLALVLSNQCLEPSREVYDFNKTTQGHVFFDLKHPNQAKRKSGTGKFIFFIILVAVLLGGGCVWWSRFASESARSKIRGAVGSVVASLFVCCEGCVACIGNILPRRGRTFDYMTPQQAGFEHINSGPDVFEPEGVPLNPFDSSA